MNASNLSSLTTRARTSIAAAIVTLSLSPAASPAAPAAPASENRLGSVGGTVTSVLTLQPIANAHVALEGTSLVATTDPDGRFLLASVPDGTYRMVIEREGFLPVLVTGVVVSPHRETPLVIRVEETVVRKEELSVTASAYGKPADLTNGAYGLGYEEVRRAPGALADIGRMIQALPGMAARDDQRNDIVARGGSPSENLTIVDGLEVPNLSHFGGQGASGGPITMLNAELITDATFLAGGFPARYGDRLSSVLDISLREGSRKGFEGEFDLGMAGAGLLLEGPLTKKGSWLISGRRSYLDLIAGAYGLTSVPVYANYQAKAVYDLSASQRLSLVSLGGWDSIDFDYDAADKDDPSTFTGKSGGWRTVTGLTWRALLGTSAVSTVTVSQAINRYETDAFDEQLAGALVERNRSEERLTTFGGDLATKTPGEGSLRLGASAKLLDSSFQIEMPLGVEDPFSSVPGARINQVDVNKDVATWQTGAHVQLGQPLGRLASVTLGTRYDRFALTDAQTWSPRAGLTIHVLPTFDLTGSVGRYHQFPSLLLLEASPGNATLSPMRADHVVGGIEFRPARDMKLSVEVYRKRYYNYPVSLELPYVTMADAGEQYDAAYLMMPLTDKGEGRSSGVEVFAQKKIGGPVWGQLSYGYSKTEQRALDGVWRRGSFDLPHVLSLVAGTKLTRRFEMSTKWTYTSGRPTTPLLYPESALQNRMVLDTSRYNEERAPAYHRLDLRFDHRTTHRFGNLIGYLELDNVYNRENVRYFIWNPKTGQRDAIPQLSFMVLGGLNVEF